MIDKNLFLETLHEVAEIAATSGEKIKPEEVHKYFEGMELSPEQEKMVYEYLNLPPEAKQAPVTEEEEVTEDAEDIETVEVYSTTILPKTFRSVLTMPQKTKKMMCHRQKMWKNCLIPFTIGCIWMKSEDAERQTKQNAGAVSADFAGRSGCCQRNRRRMVDADHSHGGYV